MTINLKLKCYFCDLYYCIIHEINVSCMYVSMSTALQNRTKEKNKLNFMYKINIFTNVRNYKTIYMYIVYISYMEYPPLSIYEKEYYKGDNLTYILTHVEIDTKHRIKFFSLLIFNEKCYLFKRKKSFHPFEDFQFCGLQYIYGDYMTPP